MNYLSWKEEQIADFSENTISEMYNRGYVLTRKGKGVMQQTRSIRLGTAKFEETSEVRRILKKGESISVVAEEIPYADYSWAIGKMAKDFYEVKAPGSFTANKVKELITQDENFTTLLTFIQNGTLLGYAICYENSEMIHYSYPFYDLTKAPKDMGLIMMNKMIQYAIEKGLKYVYLGSLQRPTDTYKLQFTGIEWFDGTSWQTDIETAKTEIVRKQA